MPTHLEHAAPGDPEFDGVFERLLLARGSDEALEQMLARATARLSAVVPDAETHLVQILLPERSGSHLGVVQSTERDDVGLSVAIDGSFCGPVFQDGETRIDGKVDEHPRYQRLTDRQSKSELAVAVRRAGRTLAVFNFESPLADAYQDAHRVEAERLANELSLLMLLYRLKLTESRILEASGALIVPHDTNEALDSVYKVVGQELSTWMRIERLQILLPAPPELVVVFSSRPERDDTRVAINQSFCGLVYEQRATLICGDVTKHNRYSGFFGSGIRSEIATPVLMDGSVIAILNVENSSLDSFHAPEQQLLEQVASWLTPYLLPVHSAFAQGHLAEELTHLLRSDHDKTALSIAVDRILYELALTPEPKIQVLLPYNGDCLIVQESSDRSMVGRTVSVDRSISGRAFKTGRTTIVDNVWTDPDYQSMLGARIRSEMDVPIRMAGAVVAVVNIESVKLAAFDQLARERVERAVHLVSLLVLVERLRLEATRSSRVDAARTTFEVLGQHAANLLHSLSSPVTAARGRLERIRSKHGALLVQYPELAEDLGRIDNCIEDVVSTIDLLRLLRFTAGEIDVNHCIKSVLERVPRSDAVEVRTELDTSLAMLANGAGLDWVVEILIKNALDAVQGRLGARLIVRSANRGQQLEIVVSDNGVGMDSKARQSAFEPKSSKKEAGAGWGGLGWGLGFVRIWAESRTGTVLLESAGEDRGSQVTVRLPIAAGITGKRG